MIYSFAELCTKDVINIENGENLGCIDDTLVDSENCSVKGFVIFGRRLFYGLFGREESIVISCSEIKLIGKDTILIKFSRNDCDNLQRNRRFELKSLFKSTMNKLLKKMLNMI